MKIENLIEELHGHQDIEKIRKSRKGDGWFVYGRRTLRRSVNLFDRYETFIFADEADPNQLRGFVLGELRNYYKDAIPGTALVAS